MGGYGPCPRQSIVLVCVTQVPIVDESRGVVMRTISIFVIGRCHELGRHGNGMGDVQTEWVVYCVAEGSGQC
jgi:hypothetical protein